MAFSIDDYLTVEEKAQIIEQRRRQWAADLYGHTLNAEAIVASGEPIPAETATAIEALQSALQSTDAKKAEVDAEVAAKAAALEASPK